MKHLTCVIDATTLVDRIHEVKQWVYNDAISIHIPLCTVEKVEQIYQASLIPKEVQKEPAPKKPSSKATRKEIPLFDINPRSAREFLLRAQGEHIKNVSFQLPLEQFTQWKEEEQQAIKAEQAPEGPPTSFAQALLRKLNFSDGNDSNGIKGISLPNVRRIEAKVYAGPAKPKLVARSTGPKSPWKPHKVPIVASTEVSPALRSLFGCMLWRLYEFENNPLMPETFVLLSNDNETRSIAQKLKVPTKNAGEVRQIVKEKQSVYRGDCATMGELERDFPMSKAVETDICPGDGIPDAKSSPSADRFDFGVEAVLEQDEEIEELKKSISKEKNTNGNAAIVSTIVNAQPLQCTDIPKTVTSDIISRTPTPPAHINGYLDESQTKPTMESKDAESEVRVPPAQDGLDGPASNVGIENIDPLPAVALSIEKGKEETQAVVKDDTDDDDEEVVVFKPKAKRLSGLAKTPTEPSRPKSADGPSSVSEAHVLTSVTKPHLPTQLKPQSPIFVPKLDHSMVKAPSQLQNEVFPEIVVQSQSDNQNHVSKKSHERTPNMLPNHRAIDTANHNQHKPHRTNMTPSHHAVDTANHNQQKPHQQRITHRPHNLRSESPAQRQSREIIERQREAINRQAQAPPKATKPPPRQIQMQPTASPTVIDPDAFDRSYVVQPRSSAPNGANGNGNGSHRAQGGRGSPRRSPAPKTPEPEVDFVLKSGSPRSSARGRGKLWVP
ncbi:hypothetical protein MMC13_000602 [Lambiella insularis]|nr:hypothetical protein [Lambiella insularis]